MMAVLRIFFSSAFDGFSGFATEVTPGPAGAVKPVSNSKGPYI